MTEVRQTVTPAVWDRATEDYLDWLENQRRTRHKGPRGGRFLTLVGTALVGACAYAGALMRRR